MLSVEGMIFTKEVLDRETQPFYWLTIYAQDAGLVPLRSFTEVLILVDDVNDNVPQTAEPVYYPTVLEGRPEGTKVIQLEAFDLDDSANGVLTFEITSGNPQGFFQIDRTTGKPRVLFTCSLQYLTTSTQRWLCYLCTRKGHKLWD